MQVALLALLQLPNLHKAELGGQANPFECCFKLGPSKLLSKGSSASMA